MLDSQRRSSSRQHGLKPVYLDDFRPDRVVLPQYPNHFGSVHDLPSQRADSLKSDEENRVFGVGYVVHQVMLDPAALHMPEPAIIIRGPTRSLIVFESSTAVTMLRPRKLNGEFPVEQNPSSHGRITPDAA